MRENIAFGAPDATDEEVERAARLAQAHEFIAELPEGYDTVIGERGITLSGGQRQRIAIARAIVTNPRILILDDATASVDATTEARIRLGLREAMKGRTTLIIAHRLSTISLADEIVVLDHGRVVARGTQGELAETSPVYREIYEHGLIDRRAAPPRLEATRREGPRQPGGSGSPAAMLQRGAEVDDWSWRRTARRISTLARLASRYKLRTTLAIVTLLAATLTVARAALPRQARARRRDPRRRLPRGRRRRHRLRRRRPAQLGRERAQTYFTGWTGERILADLRDTLFRHLQRLSLGFYERNRAGVIISRLTNDVEALDQLVTDGVTSLFQNTLILVGSAVILFVLDWRLALATLAVFPLMAVATAIFRLISSRAYRAVRERLGLVTATLAEDIAGMRVVQAFNRQSANERHFREVERPLPRGQPRHGRDQRPLLPVRRLPLDGRDRDRPRLRRLSLFRGSISRSARCSPSCSTCRTSSTRFSSSRSSTTRSSPRSPRSTRSST